MLITQSFRRCIIPPRIKYEFKQNQTDTHTQIGKMHLKIQHNFIHVERIHIKLHGSFVK